METLEIELCSYCREKHFGLCDAVKEELLTLLRKKVAGGRTPVPVSANSAIQVQSRHEERSQTEK